MVNLLQVHVEFLRDENGIKTIKSVNIRQSCSQK